MSLINDFFNDLNSPEAALWSAGVAFNRSNPLPLDKWSVFATKEDADDYVKNNPVAYPGQIIAAYDNEKMQAFIIGVNNEEELELNFIGIIPTGQGPISVSDQGVISLGVDNATIEVVDGALTLLGFTEAENGAYLVKTDEGLTWKKNDTVIDLTPKVTELESSIDLIKTQIGQKKTENAEASGIYAEIALLENAIADTDHLKRIIVNSVKDIDVIAEDAHKYIYMVPTGLQEDDDKYDEYMVLDNSLEKVGSWTVDLKDYATKQELETEVNRAKKAEADISSSISAAQDEIDDLAKTISNLDDELQEKADIVYYAVENADTGEIEKIAGEFLSPTDREKLDALVLDPDGNVGVSSSVNAENVEGLEDWISEKGSNYITNLTENNLSQELIDRIDFITTVNGKNFAVESGKLQLVAVEQYKVSGLQEALAAKAATSDLHAVQSNVTELDKILNGYVDPQEGKVSGLVESFSKLGSTVGTLNSRVESLEDYKSKLSDYYVTLSNFNSTVGNLEEIINTNTAKIDSLDTLIKESIIWQNI